MEKRGVLVDGTKTDGSAAIVVLEALAIFERLRHADAGQVRDLLAELAIPGVTAGKAG